MESILLTSDSGRAMLRSMRSVIFQGVEMNARQQPTLAPLGRLALSREPALTDEAFLLQRVHGAFDVGMVPRKGRGEPRDRHRSQALEPSPDDFAQNGLRIGCLIASSP